MTGLKGSNGFIKNLATTVKLKIYKGYHDWLKYFK